MTRVRPLLHEEAATSVFRAWSPAQLAYELGYRLELRTAGGGQRHAYLLGPTGRAHPTGYDKAWRSLTRLAKRRRLDPAAPPRDVPRALVDGRAVN